MGKYWLAFISLTLCLMNSLAKASSIAVCTNYDVMSSATLHMDMRNWFVLKRNGKSLTARIIGQANEHNGYMIGHSKPFKLGKDSFVHILSYHSKKQTLDIKTVLVATDATEKLSNLISVSKFQCE